MSYRSLSHKKIHKRQNLIGLAQLLHEIKDSGIDDVRDVLTYYRQRQRQRKLEDELQLEEEEGKANDKKSAIGSPPSPGYLHSPCSANERTTCLPTLCQVELTWISSKTISKLLLLNIFVQLL